MKEGEPVLGGPQANSGGINTFDFGGQPPVFTIISNTEIWNPKKDILGNIINKAYIMLTKSIYSINNYKNIILIMDGVDNG